MIYLECFNDEAVVRGLGIPLRAIEHEHGKTLVASALERSRETLSIGMVDQDPRERPIPYFREFERIDHLPALGLARYRHPKSQKTLIEIQPDLEPWLYSAASAAGLKPEDHHLPKEYRRLHDQPKAFEKRVREFVAALAAAGSKHLCQLQQWLRQ